MRLDRTMSEMELERACLTFALKNREETQESERLAVRVQPNGAGRGSVQAAEAVLAQSSWAHNEDHSANRFSGAQESSSLKRRESLSPQRKPLFASG